jgi:hypothetical protein
MHDRETTAVMKAYERLNAAWGPLKALPEGATEEQFAQAKPRLQTALTEMALRNPSPALARLADHALPGLEFGLKEAKGTIAMLEGVLNARFMTPAPAKAKAA